MKVKQFIKMLNKLDQNKDIKVVQYDETMKAYWFKGGCKINEEIDGGYLVFPNDNNNIKLEVELKNIKNTKQYHALRKIQKEYELKLKIAKSQNDVERQVEIEKQLNVATRCLKALFE